MDNTLVISEKGEYVLMEQIGKYFELKEEYIGPTNIYLDKILHKAELENSVKAQAFVST